jgi:SulP family sulfate permease
MTLLWLTPLLFYLPQATLAAVIIVSVAGLIKIQPIYRIWRIYRYEGIVAGFTFFLTLVFSPDLELGVLTGVVLSLVFYLYKTMHPRIIMLTRDPETGTFRNAKQPDLKTCKYISVIRFDGQLYFGNAGYFEDEVLDRVSVKSDLKYIVFDARGINRIDSTGEEMLRALAEHLRTAGIEILISFLKKQVADNLRLTGFIKFIGSDHVFTNTRQAARYALKHIEGEHEEDCPLRPEMEYLNET